MQLLKNLWFVFLENINYFGILLLIFFGITLLVFGLFRLLTGGPGRTEKRLSKLTGGSADPQKTETEKKSQFIGQQDETFASRITRPIQKMSSLDDRKIRNRLKLKLIRAGYRSNQAIYNFLAAKIFVIILFVGAFLLTKIYYNFSFDILIRTFLLALLGYFVPNMWVWLMTKARQERIVKGLPDALDLMVVCVEAGLGLDMTFKRVGEEMESMCKDISDEFKLTILEIRAGSSRDLAFRNMVARTDVPEINSLVTVLTQTSRFGTSMAQALRVHADAMRVRRRQLAEEVAAKSTVKLVFPLVLFIFPAIFVVLVGSGAIRIIKYLLPALGGG